MRILICTSLLVAATASASTWHVAPGGSDAAAGTQAAPFATIQHAADVVQPGDTVIVHAGTYTGFQVGAQGTQAAPVVFEADGEVDIDGTRTSDQDAIHIEGASWVTVQGFTVTHATRAGISALDCDHITVRANKVDQNGKWGIFSGFCDYFTVEGNEASRSGTQHGIYASNSADHPVIRNNKVWGNAMCGIHMNGDITQGGDGVISGALVEGNVIYDNGKLGGSAINCDGVASSVFRNNVLDGNHASGISLYQIDGGAPSTGNLVVNNTIRMASDARFAVNIQNGSTGNVVRNNILLDVALGKGAIDICGACLSGFVADHDAVSDAMSVDGNVMSLAAWQGMTGQGAASFATTDTALLLDTNLAPRPGSPVIDAGSADQAPAVDVTGTTRPQGAAVDIGAYEACDGACTGGGSGSGSGTGDGSGSGSGSGSGTGTGSGSGSGTGSGDGYSGSGGGATAGGGGGCSSGGAGGLLVGLAVLGLGRRRRAATRDARPTIWPR